MRKFFILLFILFAIIGSDNLLSAKDRNGFGSTSSFSRKSSPRDVSAFGVGNGSGAGGGNGSTGTGVGNGNGNGSGNGNGNGVGNAPISSGLWMLMLGSAFYLGKKVYSEWKQ